MKVDEMAPRNHSFKPLKSDKGEDTKIRLKKNMKKRQKQESVIL